MSHRSDPKRARSLAARLLSRAGHDDPDVLLAEIDDAAGEARHPRVWKSWQVLLLCAYALRDRVRRPTAGSRTAPALRPLLALRLAARGLAHRPAIPVVAALTLAVGFGAAAAIYSVYVGFGLPLPVPEGERVVQVRVVEPSGETEVVAAGVRREWVGAASFAGLGAYRTTGSVLSIPGRGAVRTGGAALDAAAFRLLRVAPAIGRLPGANDHDALLLSDELWRQHFDADPDVLGREVRVDGRSHVVVGVMPERFGFPFSERAWTLLADDDPDPAAVVARLAPGIGRATASAELQGRLGELRESADPARVRVLGFTESRGEGGEVVGLIALLVLVVALLLVSSTNVANLLLVRAGARARTLAVHVAIGARPTQVAFQLLVEAFLIAVMGALVGLAAARLAVAYIETTLSGHWGYHWMEVAVRPSVLAFTFGLATITAVACGVVPALRLARADLTVPLKGETAGPLAEGRPSPWLVGAQVAFSSAAVVVAALMVTGLIGSQRVDERFPADEVRVASLSMDGDRYDGERERADLRRSLLERLLQREEIAAVAMATGLPGLNAYSGRLETDTAPASEDAPVARVAALAVSPGYPEILNLRLLAGRDLRPGDEAGEELVALVSESFTREHLGGEGLDRLIRLTGGGLPDRWARVVGVVSDVVIYADRGEEYRDRVYLPLGQVEPRSLYLLYRSGADAVAAGAAIRTTALALDPDLPVGAALGAEPGEPLASVLAYVRRLFFTIGVLGAFGGVAALLVAMIGLYGLLAFEVQSRVAEIGVRMALGADPSTVLLQVVRRGLRGLAPGLVLGAAAAWLGGPLFGIFLMGAEARDPLVFAATAALYLSVGAAAAWLPARRAASLDPAASLRAE